MRAHLLRSHARIPPASWDAGHLHQDHLTLHLADQTPEEKPMPEVHEHGDIARFHDAITRSTLVSHLEYAHGLNRQDIDLRELYSQHASLHPMAVELCGAENPQYPGEYTCEYPAGHGLVVDPDEGDMPIIGTYDHGAPSKGAWWTMPPVKVSANKEQMADISHVNRPKLTEGERQILEDRLICVMAGIDFDLEWAADSGIGSSGRGVFRRQYGNAAKELLTWLEHGGALHLPPVASLATDLEREQGLVEDLEAANNTLREQLATTGRQLEEATGERDLLRQDKARLKDDLEAVSEERNNALEAVMGAQSKAADLRQQLEEAQGDARHLNQLTSRVQGERVQADRRAYETQKQLDRVRQLLTARTEALANGQAALGELISTLEREGWESSSVLQSLKAILAGQGPKVSTCTVAHLGLATTGDLLAEISTRIEAGHGGLTYRTVDPA